MEEIIQVLKGQRRYFVGAFPFYNTQNSQLYSLIHCTSHIEGFKLYKQVAWKSFGGKSSTKDTHGGQYQLSFDFSNNGFLVPATDESCFFVTDIAKYLQKPFSGQTNVPLESLWQLLDYHPIFPSNGFRQEIRSELKNTYGAIFSTAVNPTDGKKYTIVSFQKGTPTLGILPISLAELSDENEYGITLISLDEEYRKEMEPGQHPIKTGWKH